MRLLKNMMPLLLTLFLTGCSMFSAPEVEINFGMQPMGGVVITEPEEGEEVEPVYVSVSEENETVIHSVYQENGAPNELYGGAPIVEISMPLTSIVKEENKITYTYLDQDNSEVTEEFEVMSGSVIKDLSNNNYYEYFGPKEWAPEGESN